VHIEDCLARLAALPDLAATDRQILDWAIWWHDAVYDPTRGDNEALSAELAARDLPALGADDAAITEVVRLILLTRGHHVEPGDRLGALMVSIDLSILGADPAAYEAYAQAIRAEYAHVPDDAYRLGRAQVLARFAAEPVLFADPDFAARFDAPARRNLAAEIARLSAG
jgi:predicted metal-dependent HD superfamily phosphohydrolase